MRWLERRRAWIQEGRDLRIQSEQTRQEIARLLALMQGTVVLNAWKQALDEAEAGSFDQYLPYAGQMLDEAGFVDPEDGTIPRWREGDPIPIWTSPEEAARAILTGVGPLIRQHAAEEIAQALESFEANDIRGRADMSIDRAAAIAREIGEHATPLEDQ